MKGIQIIILASFVLFGLQQERKTKVCLIGDSTIANKEIKAYPETGWGMPFSYFFDSTITVDNRAKNGRSTHTFISENLWQPVVNELKEGDYVFIQFGHNDESKEKTDRYTAPEDFKANLVRFVIESRNKKAIPVLISPVSRRYFDSLGNIKETHKIYSNLVEEVAKKYHVPFIDLDAQSRVLFQKFGPVTSKLLFMQLEVGEHPNYPEGRNDNTHFNELGARLIAEIVLADIKKLDIGLANHIRPSLKLK